MNKLNKNAQLWVDLLRSGELEQGQGNLQYGNSYCALGAACVAYERATGSEALRDILGEIEGEHLGYHRRVMEWLNLRDRTGKMAYRLNGFRTLVDLNDSGNYTFEQLADIIESKPEGLFND